MKVKELEKKINQLITLNNLRFRVEEKNKTETTADLDDSGFLKLQNVYQGEIIVYICVNDSKEVLLKIMPPDDDIESWYVDSESTNCLYDETSLPIYINILKIALKFLEDKNESKSY